MKKKLLIIGGIVLGIGGIIALGFFVPPPDGFLRAPIPQPEYVTAPENNTYKIGVQNYQVELNADITADMPLKYKLGDKYFAMKPVAIAIDGKEIKQVSNVLARIDPKTYYYDGVFGVGTGLDMNFGDRIWNKLVWFNAQEAVGLIPAQAQNIQLVFEVDTNFVVDGWNKYDDFEITDKVRLGDYSYLEPAFVWDSYSEEVCWIEYETICDPQCTEDTETCDVCDSEERCDIQNHRQQIRSWFWEDKGKLYYTKEIPVDWIKNAQFPIYTDADVTYGTAQSFTSNSVIDNDVAVLDTNKFVNCWSDADDLYSGQCIVGTVSGTTITFGTQSEYDDDTGPDHSDVCALDTDKFSVVYVDDALLDDGYTRAVTVSGTTIGTWGTAYEFETGDAEDMSCIGFNTTTDGFVVSYLDETNSDTSSARACTVSGTTNTCGTIITYDAVNDLRGRDHACAKVDDNKVVCAWNCDEASCAGDWASCAMTISTRTITYGSVDFASTIPTGYTSITSPDTDKFIVGAYYNYTDGAITVGTVSGTTITTGTTTTVTEDNTAADWGATSIDTTHVIVSYADYSDGQYGKTRYCEINFSTRVPSCNDPETFNASATRYTDTEMISEDKIVVCYTDDGDANDIGYCIIGDYSEAAPPAAAAEDPPIIIIVD